MKHFFAVALLITLIACPTIKVDNINLSNNELTSAQKTELLALVNAKRASGFNCPGGFRAATGALSWNTKLEQMALGHTVLLASKAVDIQAVDPHAGIGDGDVVARAQKVGYGYATIGENIAAGQTSVQSVVDAWFASSSGHCDNLMDKDFTQVGLALQSVASGPFKTYWTLNLGKPQ